MKVILLTDVARIGRRYEIKEVADGYGRTVLIGRGRALLATPENLRKVEAERRVATSGVTRDQKDFGAIVAYAAKHPLVMVAPASTEGHLFAGLHARDLAAALKAASHLPVASEWFVLPSPLKSIGTSVIKLKTAGETGSLVVDVRRAATSR